MMGPPSMQLHAGGTNDGHATRDGSADAETPVGVLIEAQDLAGEGHAESHQQKKDADDPGEFAGKFVGAKKEDLHHVDEHDGDHEVGAPAVEGANEPAEGDVVIKDLQAVPGFGGGRNVDKREQNAGDDLQDKNGEGGAAENVAPTGGVARDGMLGGFADAGRRTASGVRTSLRPGRSCAWRPLLLKVRGGRAGSGKFAGLDR